MLSDIRTMIYIPAIEFMSKDDVVGTCYLLHLSTIYYLAESKTFVTPDRTEIYSENTKSFYALSYHDYDSSTQLNFVYNHHLSMIYG